MRSKDLSFHHPLAFWLGCAAVIAGVLAHLPMLAMAAPMHFRLAGMPMDKLMLTGMALVPLGVLLAGYGLMPRLQQMRRTLHPAREPLPFHAADHVPLNREHWKLVGVLTVALAVDVMKPATIGFVMPGLSAEYGISGATAGWLALSALTGTVVGSIVWGRLGDLFGRRATILLSALMFMGTAICGAMPSFGWNLVMCFMMGAAAGGMLPVTYALLAEMMPSKHRGWSLVLIGGLGAVGGYFAASGFSALLQPVFGWRILWLLNLPSGLILVLLGGLIPESAKFLLARGRDSEARAVMARFGSTAKRLTPLPPLPAGTVGHALTGAKLIGKLAALSIAAVAWGLINFGLLLWLPADLVAKGYSVALSSKLLAESALIAFPTVFVAALMYSRWSTKWSLVTMIGVTLLGLVGVLRLELAGVGSPVLPVALLIVGSNGIIAILLPYTAESFPLRVRGRATGWVAACTKGGGVAAQALSIAALVPAMGVTAGLIIVPTALALGLCAWFGRETRGRDLRLLDDAIAG